MNFVDLWLYAISAIIIIATPGPVVILMASAGLKDGYSSAFKTILGSNVASLILLIISACILKELIAIDERVFLAIKVLGSLYIAYLGFDILKSYFAAKQDSTKSLHPLDGGFRKGFFIGISNPKYIVFFSSFFPQFIGVHSNINISLAILALTWFVLYIITLSVIYKAFGLLAESEVYQKTLGGFGVLLIVIACYGLFISLEPVITSL